jgi:hypothetical protein
LPNPAIAVLKGRRRKLRLIGACVVVGGVAVIAPGWIPPLVSVIVLAIALATAARLWNLGGESVRSFILEGELAVAAFDSAERRWLQLQSPPEAFKATRQRLDDNKSELMKLPTIKAQRLAELNASLRHKQLTRFLEQHKIEDASIPGIGPGRKTLLRCYGVEDASDIHPSRLQIKGFGPALRSALLVWRSSLEQTFVFDPSAGIDPADLRQLDQELALKRAALIQSLSTGPQQLRQALLPRQVERSKVFSQIDMLAKRLAQAEVDMKALGRF